MLHSSTDTELITAARNGSAEALDHLYRAHIAAANNLAQQLARHCVADREDFVSEAFERVFAQLRVGAGPDSAFRAYLLTALRRIAYDKTRRDRHLELVEDMATSPVAEVKLSVPFRDTAVASLERSMAARAFAKLPERWQTVLWHTTVENQPVSQAAEVVGLTANGTSALAYRAREGLRQAYLQVHLAEPAAPRCRPTVNKLGHWTRRGLSRREAAQVEEHLARCACCRQRADELADVADHFRRAS